MADAAVEVVDEANNDVPVAEDHKQSPVVEKADTGGKPDLQDGSSRPLPNELSRYKRPRPSETRLLELDMAKCNVKPRLLSTLCEYVALLNTPLVSLTLSRNALGPKGAELLGKALITNNTLQFLELEQCELIGSAYRPQHEGIKALAKGFESVRSTLRSVSLADNALQPEGCRIVLGALSFHPTLTALDISNNVLASFNEKQGYLALSYVIQYAKQLCWLALDGNMLPPASWRVLQTSLATNATLTSLSAQRCGITIEQLRLPVEAKHSVLTDLEC